MDDKESYGVVLELITTEFSKKVKETINIVKKMGNKFKVGLNYDSKAETDIANKVAKLQKKLEGLLSEKKRISLFPNAEKEFNEVSNKINSLRDELDSLRKGFTDAGKEYMIGDVKVTDVTGGPQPIYDSAEDEAKAQAIQEQIDLYSEQYKQLADQQIINHENLSIVEDINTQIEETNSELQENQTILNSFPTVITKIGQAFTSVKNKISSVKQSISEVKSEIKGMMSSFSSKTGLSKLFGKLKGDAKGFGSSIKSAFDNGIKSIKRYSAILLGVRGVYGILTRAVRTYLSEHQAVANQMKAMFSGLGDLLAPAIEYVIGLFSKLLSYINAFIKMLTGVDLFAKGMKSVEKSAKSTAGSVKKIQGGLAGIDEITNIANDSDSGGGDSGIGDVSVLPKVDLKPLEKLKDFLSKILQPFKDAWDNTKEYFITSFTDMVSSLSGMFGSIGSSLMEVWTNGTGTEIIENLLTGWGLLFNIIGNVADAIKKAWDNNSNGLKLVQSIANVFKTIQDFCNSILDSLAKWTASEGFQEALDRILTFLKDIFGYIEDICTWLVDMYKKYFKPVIDDAILPAISSIITAIGDIWKAVKPVVDKVIEIIKKVLEPVIKTLTDIIGGIVKVIKGIADFVSGVFTGDWKKAWGGIKTIFSTIWDTMKNVATNVMNGIKTVVKTVLDAIVGIIKTPINAILSAFEWLINKLVDGWNYFKKMLNKLSFDIPDWVPFIGGNKFGFNFAMTSAVKLPRLEVGTPYVEAGGLAYLDQGEAVIPEKFNDRKYFGNDEETKDLIRQIIETIEEKDMNTYLDGKVIGETAKNYINNQARMLGRSVI